MTNTDYSGKREIKFRAWDKNNKIMWGNRQSFEMLMRQAIHDFYCSQPNNGQDYKGEIVWMQFTGLKDKNGKEIYEGDIITMPIDKLGPVEWELDRARWSYRNKNNGLIGFSMAYNVEVIGNIYENPELLK